MGALEVLIPLPLPHWETPEQWEKRTGEAWPVIGAVYWRFKKDVSAGDERWHVSTLDMARHTAKFVTAEANKKQIICATEAGPPLAWEVQDE
jgi:hypothetical protein